GSMAFGADPLAEGAAAPQRVRTSQPRLEAADRGDISPPDYAGYRAENPLFRNVSQKDAHVTRLIRQELIKEDLLSTEAKNVRIVSTDGKVTLRGPVADAAEKERVESVARRIVGP